MRKSQILGAIWAQSRNGVIGKDGQIPWRLREDLVHFRKMTEASTLIMGRRTWESLPDRMKVYPVGRQYVVVTSQEIPGVQTAPSLTEALRYAAHNLVWVIGGERLLNEALEIADVAVATLVDIDVEGDTFSPENTSRDWVIRNPEDQGQVSETGLKWRVYRLTPEVDSGYVGQ